MASAQPNAEAIKMLREAKPWVQETLAAKSDLSLRTIQKIEGGANCNACTLVAIANALGVDYSEVVIKNASGSLYKRSFSVEIKFDFLYDEFDQSEQLNTIIETLKRLISASGEMYPSVICRGSVIITFVMEQQDAILLMDAIVEDRLKELPIEYIAFVELQMYLPTTHTKEASKREREKLTIFMTQPGDSLQTQEIEHRRAEEKVRFMKEIILKHRSETVESTE
jgi:transcriptional regulator with XRE-family HTH domain